MSRANETEAFVENKNLLAESEQQIYANVDAQFVRHFQRRIALSIRRRVLLTRFALPDAINFVAFSDQNRFA